MESFPESKIHNICSGGMITGQSGYMTSPGYPHVYSPDLDCSATISVEENTNFMVTILGSDLPKNTCSDQLKISPSNGQFTEFCEQVFLLPVQMNFSFHNSGDIEFRFSTRPDTTHHHKGFSLRFDKTPLPPGQQTTTRTTNSPGIVTIVTRKKCINYVIFIGPFQCISLFSLFIPPDNMF